MTVPSVCVSVKSYSILEIDCSVCLCFSKVVQYHGVDPLVTMLKDTRQHAAANAAMVLTNMAPDENNRYSIQQSGVIPAVIEPLQSP